MNLHRYLKYLPMTGKLRNGKSFFTIYPTNANNKQVRIANNTQTFSNGKPSETRYKAMLLSYFVGQKKYPIQYDLKSIGKYVAAAIALYLVSEGLPFENVWVLLAIRTCLLLVFVGYIVKNDFPLNRIKL